MSKKENQENNPKAPVEHTPDQLKAAQMGIAEKVPPHAPPPNAPPVDSSPPPEKKSTPKLPADAIDGSLVLPSARYKAEGESYTIRAQRMDVLFFLPSGDLKLLGNAGDWLILFQSGQRVFVNDATFKAKCKPVK